MAGHRMAIVVLYLCGGGACLVGGCGLIRRALRTAGGPAFPPPFGTGAHAARPDGGRAAGRAAARSAVALIPTSTIRQGIARTRHPH
jgi:hypothetical protein